MDDSPGGAMTTTSCVAVKDFTEDAVEKQLEEYVQTWELQRCWLYTLDFLFRTEEEHRTFYHYRARFGVPTAGEPVPGTASVRFDVCVSRVGPAAAPVEVRFAVESSRLMHAPAGTRFREEWLEDVVERKALLRREAGL